MVVFPLHHGAVKTPPWWSGAGTMVFCLCHRGVSYDFTMAEKIFHHGEVSFNVLQSDVLGTARRFSAEVAQKEST